MASVPSISTGNPIEHSEWGSAVKSTNFEFLKPRWPELAVLGSFAERYTNTDPTSALVKLRSFCEQVVEFLFNHHGLPRPYQANLFDLLEEASFVEAVPSVVLSKLHSLRIKGNEAAHGKPASEETAEWMLREAFDLGRWLAVSYLHDRQLRRVSLENVRWVDVVRQVLLGAG